MFSLPTTGYTKTSQGFAFEVSRTHFREVPTTGTIKSPGILIRLEQRVSISAPVHGAIITRWVSGPDKCV